MATKKYQQWVQEDALALCALIEKFAPEYGCHVALTGGCLYKEGERKDVDIMFYRIRELDEIDEAGLLQRLGAEGFTIGKRFGWVVKATLPGELPWTTANIDFFFPESTHNDDGNPYRSPNGDLL